MSSSPEKIIQILRATYPFMEKEDIDILMDISEIQILGNKEVFIHSGQVDRRILFLLNGMIRGYFINNKGEEKNIFLRPKHTITGAPDCLFRNEPSKYTFESILESELLVFKIDDIIAKMQTRPNLMRLYIDGLQENVQTLISRVEALIDLSPAKRYEALLQRSPQFFQTAFNKHIANYLGMTPVSLSRIIKRRKQSDS